MEKEEFILERLEGWEECNMGTYFVTKEPMVPVVSIQMLVIFDHNNGTSRVRRRLGG